jgi:hypothetical protein
MYVAPNGKVFCAGPDAMTRYLDVSGTGSWSDVAATKFGFRGDVNNLQGATSVMYDDGKILIAGGGNVTTSTARAEVIDLNAARPAWREIPPMRYPRRNLSSTLLPDGKVLVTGGCSGGDGHDPRYAVHAAEMWDPATETWAEMAPNPNGVPRMYHSTAVLLPDGRVLSGGGGCPGWLPGEFHPNVEFYSPPYLFKGSRPAITNAPASVTYGARFNVKTPDAAGVTAVTWIRLSSQTHSFNQSQRMNRLFFTKTGKDLKVTAPTSRNLCPPGHYMLFLLNARGVPSVAKIIQIG